MRLQLTVLLSSPGERRPPSPTEVEVEAPLGATADQLAHAVVTCLTGQPATGAQTLWVRGSLVDAHEPLGTEPLVDGAAIALALGPRPSSPPRPPATRTPVTLAIAHGPDAGRTVELTPGAHTVGRGSEAAITVADPRLSRLHATVTVTADSITVADAGSTNGTELDGHPVGVHPEPAQVGSTIGVGDSLLVLRAGDGLPAAVAARGDGTLAVNRRPRLLGCPEPQSISLPSPPAVTHPARVPWVAMLLPVPVAGVMALLFGPMMLAFAVMSPLLMAGTVVGDRLTGRRRYAAEHAAYLRRLRRVEGTVAAARGEEERRLRSALPDPAQCLVTATTPTAQLWERRRADPDALTVSIGSCNTPASFMVVGGPDADPENPLLERVPCRVPLGEVGVTGLCGDRRTVLGVLRTVLGQLVTLHSPLDLELVLVSGASLVDEEWSWLARLPHVRTADGHPRDGWLLGLDHANTARDGVAALASEVRRRRADQQGRGRHWAGPRTLVVLDGAAALRGLPDLAEVLEDGPAVGVCVVAVNADRHGLPSESRAVLDLSDPATPELLLPGAAPARPVVDRVGPWWADRLSRALAPLRDATPGPAETSPPETAGLCALLGLTDRDAMEAAVTRTWSRSARSTVVPIGHTTDGPFRVDLASDGPHVLVAGTTGSGKSELLRTLVASLAVHHRPEHLSIVLIDYKGGAAFRACAPLPHVAAVVTDLDDHLASRALTSLRAELKRRERLLAAAGAPDFLSYQSSPTSTAEQLPRLVVVIDEFRALAEELPHFVDGMVAVAALGRSLGIHLVLATQRPAGVVTADIKANMNLRIALRLRDVSDSLDVIDAPDAAAIDPASPGRALARVGGRAVTTFHTAHAGARARDRQPDGLRVRRLPWGQAAAPWPGSQDDDGGAATDLSTVVAAVAFAAAAVGARPAAPPWLPALPALIAGQSLPVGAGRKRFPIGLCDEPRLQRQSPLEVDLDEPGHWAFVGGPGSGRSSALLAVAGMATTTRGPNDLHLYAVSGGSLAAVEAMPHCGAHVGIDDLARLERLTERLSGELALRRRGLATAGHATMGAWQRADPTTAPATLLLVIDDWDLLTLRAEEHHGQVPSRLLGLLREGAGLGLTAALAGDRALLVGRAASAATHRVLFRMNDPTDLLLAGLPPRSAPAEQPPGRGILQDGTEVQIVSPPPPPPTAEIVERGGPDAGGGPTHSSRRPWRVDALPERVDASSLSSRGQAEDLVIIGVGGDELAPRGLSPGEDGRLWAVLGPSGSGVSSALITIAAGLLSQGRPLCVVASGSGPWDALRQDERISWCDDPGRADELVALRRRVPDLGVLVDDADQLLDTPLDTVLREMTGLVDRDRGLVVVGARADAVSVQYRGLAVGVARHRTGVLLAPTGATTDLLGVRVPVDRAAGPGRGYLVRAGVAIPVQVASTTVRQ